MEFIRKNAIYQQIADFLCENILLRTWKEGDRIPSVRELAARMEVNPNTALRAFTFLQEREIIENRRGIGFFVAAGGYEKTREMLRRDFMNTNAVALFRTMEILGITIDEVRLLYEKHGQRSEERLPQSGTVSTQEQL